MILNRAVYILLTALLAGTLLSHGAVIPIDELESDCARDTDFAQGGIFTNSQGALINTVMVDGVDNLREIRRGICSSL
ncbi:hypothetical protein IW261DRAFT_863779 [Armillaria novae-zelandiae]|uniref:Uncharacterized protein n=1 Tax=Armillaria novae-zelandiae TaxID=153914 RepID=A0AA39PIU5_9AGAR|nr:hypothetical protein IW261DRAFT_863779 [Armillaria novae-zelandiae]